MTCPGSYYWDFSEPSGSPGLRPGCFSGYHVLPLLACSDRPRPFSFGTSAGEPLRVQEAGVVRCRGPDYGSDSGWQRDSIPGSNPLPLPACSIPAPA